MLLDHAISIQAAEWLELVIIEMASKISKKDRQDLIQRYQKLIDGDEPLSSAIIKRDRERARKLLFNKK